MNKAKLFAGQKGKYLDATVFIDLENMDEWGNNGMITQKAGKDEQGNILGNAKIFWKGEAKSGGASGNQTGGASQAQGNQGLAEPDFDFDDDIPF